uniref:Putative LRR receptor-like serine/threonine-protein kinase n=1 Tax=Noccaea caerulescens TaxID=107243 RepID=A0A1J3K677_NOCCA
MSGEIPSSIGNITRLETLSLFNNSFEGTIPPALGNCMYLLHLSIGYNKLNGTIPREIMQLSPLVTLSMEGNSLSGSLPKDVGRLEHLIKISLEHNDLSGKLPPGLGNCLSMEEIYLQGNSFDGDIPDLKGLVGVRRVDLSNNNLSGSIPGYFANFSKLEYLNLSFNILEGRVPTEGKFQNATIVSVFGNKNLCGGIKEVQLKPCLAQAPKMRRKHPFLSRKVVIGVSTCLALLLLLFMASVSMICFRKIKKNQHTNNPAPFTLEVFHEKISYGDLRNATDGFSSKNLIGSGSFGTVFKAFLPRRTRLLR